MNIRILLTLFCALLPAVFLASLASASSENPAKISVTFSEQSGIYSLSDKKTITISAAGVSNGVDDMVVQLACKDAFGNISDLLPASVLLQRSSDFKKTLSLPSSLGYYDLSYGIKENASATLTNPGSVSLAIIPNVKIMAKQASSPFGVNTHFNQGWDPAIGSLVGKLGIAWIHDGEASMDDRAFPVAKANNLCYVPLFTRDRNPPMQNRKEDGTWDFSDIAQWHRQYAKKYGADVDFYDLNTEPHGPWSAALGGAWNGGAWQDIYVQYCRAMTKAIKAGDPGAKVLWTELDILLFYKQFFELGAGDVIDIISPHPYNLHRSLPLPEQQSTLGQLAEYRDFIRLHKLSWPLWAGEVGYSSFNLTSRTPGNFYSPNSELQQAQKLTRMMVLFLSHGYEKIFWYDFKNDGVDSDNQELNFGLVHNDSSPKPAAIAYANLIARLKGCKWLGSYAIGGAANACAYVVKASKPTLIAWKQNGGSTETLLVPSNVKTVTVTDMFGSSKQLSVSDHTLSIDLTESPVYVDGLLMSDITQFVTGP